MYNFCCAGDAHIEGGEGEFSKSALPIAFIKIREREREDTEIGSEAEGSDRTR